jgi:uncharacterized protein (TIGR00255 family)
MAGVFRGFRAGSIQFTIRVRPQPEARPMALSMTAFARHEAVTPWGGLSWELRSVNHRYLESSFRLPEELRAIEMRARELIGQRLARGKVDANLRFQAQDSAAGTLDLDEAQLKRMLAAADRVHETANGVAPLRAIDCLRWPGVVRTAALDVEGLAAAALDLLGRTLDDLVATRAREGARLKDLLVARLDAMGQIVTTVQQVLPEVQTLYRERLLNRLNELRQSLDPNRLEQELVLFAQRTDVSEELDRLTAHVAEFRRVLDGSGQIGRRLDFLSQELNREANTLGSKSADLRQTNASVDLKVLIEQVREQVQNIE